MEYERIPKPGADEFAVRPNLDDYEGTRAAFDYERVIDELDGLPGGGLNIAYESLDRHVAAGNGEKACILWESKDGRSETYTYADMARLSNQFANVLQQLGVEKGSRVFVFMDRTPELYAAVFGALKAGCIIGPLFSAFGPDAIRDRLENSGAVVLVTTPKLKTKVYEVRDDLPELKHLIIADHDAPPETAEGELSWNELMAAAPETFEIVATGPEDPAIMHYTSGTTGKPKGAVHVHKAVLGHYATGKFALDMHPDDIYWCTADPGWVTGTSYGMFAPCTNGVTSVIYEGGFSARAWYEVIAKYKVTVWYTAPTAIRMLMKAGEEAPKKHDLSSLRYTIYSFGKAAAMCEPIGSSQ
ncbi:MAG: AMP-binding protein [Planctomycetes bacterium]|nr:AMP-binding protein [Planctomycetota bacterium]